MSEVDDVNEVTADDSAPNKSLERSMSEFIVPLCSKTTVSTERKGDHGQALVLRCKRLRRKAGSHS